MTSKTKNWLVFLLGLGAITEIRVIGSIGLSELACYFLAPFLFWAHFALFKRLRFGLFFSLLALWGFSAVLADYVAQTYVLDRWKGVAPIYSIFAVTVCATVLLSDDIKRVRWFLVGAFLSALIASFVFTPAAVVESAAKSGGGATSDSAFNYSAWYYGTIGAVFVLPVQLAYPVLPLWVSMGLVAAGAIMQLLLGGRGAFLVALVALAFLWFGRQARQRSYRPRRMPVIMLTVVLLIVGVLAKGVYEYAVSGGYMGDQELAKYETQTKTGSSAWSLLLRGRGETFAGFFAAFDKPILGHGSKAWDTAGYYQAFVEKYGDKEDVRQLVEAYSRGIILIPAHSHIVAAWLWHGAGGLLFWLYVLWLLYKTASLWMWHVPELIGWFALIIPSMFWNVLFSPLGSRVSVAVALTCFLLSREAMLVARNVRQQQVAMPGRKS